MGTGRYARSFPGDADDVAAETHIEGTVLEFIVRLHGRHSDRLRLPRPFAKVMEVDKPQGVWLHVHGYRNGVVYADAEYPAPRVILLRHGWKTFTRAHNLMVGHVLHFKLVEANMVSVKIYGHSIARLGCCKESMSDAESSSWSDSDEGDSANGDNDNDRDSESPTFKSYINHGVCFHFLYKFLVKGAFAVYLEPSHADIFEFLDLRKNHGKIYLIHLKSTLSYRCLCKS
ncbi:ribonucleotide diphosphate reductase [Hordeum vulgare]|nr:ribonucleotide diphosphate reductase [Hordeum vulgare]